MICRKCGERMPSEECHKSHGAGCGWWLVLFLAAMTCAEYEAKYEALKGHPAVTQSAPKEVTR